MAEKIPSVVSKKRTFKPNRSKKICLVAQFLVIMFRHTKSIHSSSFTKSFLSVDQKDQRVNRKICEREREIKEFVRSKDLHKAHLKQSGSIQTILGLD